MFFPISAWFAAFVLTVVVEAPIAWFLLRRVEPNVVRVGLLVLVANLATHPIVWYVFTQLFLVGTLEYTLAVETWAVAAEALFYGLAVRGLSSRRAITVAVAANLGSFLAGRVVGLLWPDLLS